MQVRKYRLGAQFLKHAFEFDRQRCLDAHFTATQRVPEFKTRGVQKQAREALALHVLIEVAIPYLSSPAIGWPMCARAHAPGACVR